jgi:hypothetical protein
MVKPLPPEAGGTVMGQERKDAEFATGVHKRMGSHSGLAGKIEEAHFLQETNESKLLGGGGREQGRAYRATVHPEGFHDGF